jgi:hypothetical protein
VIRALNGRRYPAAMPAAAPLTLAARRFAIKLPRPRGIGVAMGVMTLAVGKTDWGR